MASAERIIELLDEQPTVIERADARTLERAAGRVAFRDVAFRIPAPQGRLGGASFGVEPDEVVAVIGRSGAGKSTLAKLLLRFYDPTAGAITIDGADIRSLTLALAS